MRILIAVWLLVLLAVLGCTNSIVYKEKVAISNSIWTYDNPLQFNFSIKDTSVLYEVLLAVNHRSDYGYQNLYVKILTGFPNQSVKEDVVSLEFADDNGLWNGSCRQNKCHLKIPLQEKTYFSEPGDYSITLEQFMRENPIEGVESMELILTKID